MWHITLKEMLKSTPRQPAMAMSISVIFWLPMVTITPYGRNVSSQVNLLEETFNTDRSLVLGTRAFMIYL